MFHFPHFTVMIGGGIENSVNPLEYQIQYVSLHLFNEVGRDNSFYVSV
jgi:hypothetical protein